MIDVQFSVQRSGEICCFIQHAFIETGRFIVLVCGVHCRQHDGTVEGRRFDKLQRRRAVAYQVPVRAAEQCACKCTVVMRVFHDDARFVTQAFTQRRKTLRNNFKGALTDADWEALEIDPTARAETPTINDFIAITHRLSRAIE